MRQKIRLINQTGGHNKYYEMEDQGSSFTVTYGRIDSTANTHSYPITQWNKKYNEKIKKGYTNVSHSVLSFEEIFADLDAKIEAMELREAMKTAANY